MRSFSTLLLSLSLPFYVLAGHVDSRAHRHAEVALRARGHLQKRFSGPFTYYDITVGPVACQGQHFPASAFVVAMNSADFGGGSACGKQITITVNGKPVGASIVDLCPGCGPHGLDLTAGLFQAFAPLGEGVLHGDWEWGSGGGGDGPAKPPPPPATTHHTTTHDDPPPPPPTTTPHTTSTSQSSSSSTTTTSTTEKPTSTPSTTSTSSSTSTSPVDVPSGNDDNIHGLAKPNGTITPDGQSPENLYELYQLIIGFGSAVSYYHP